MLCRSWEEPIGYTWLPDLHHHLITNRKNSCSCAHIHSQTRPYLTCVLGSSPLWDFFFKNLSSSCNCSGQSDLLVGPPAPRRFRLIKASREFICPWTIFILYKDNYRVFNHVHISFFSSQGFYYPFIMHHCCLALHSVCTRQNISPFPGLLGE